MRGRKREDAAEPMKTRVLDGRLSVVVQPPLNVANSILEEVRKLAHRFRETEGEAAWIAPQDYAASLAELMDDGVDPDAGITALLTETLQGVSEIGARLAQPEMEDLGESKALVVTRLYGKEDEVEGLAKAICEGLEESGYEVARSGSVRIPLARVEGADNIEAMRGCIEDRDVPVAGWLLGGVCLARTAESESGLPRVVRTTYIPLKRIGSRRK